MCQYFLRFCGIGQYSFNEFSKNIGKLKNLERLTMNMDL